MLKKTYSMWCKSLNFFHMSSAVIKLYLETRLDNLLQLLWFRFVDHWLNSKSIVVSLAFNCPMQPTTYPPSPHTHKHKHLSPPRTLGVLHDTFLLSQSPFPFTLIFPSLLCRFQDLPASTLRETHTQARAHTHTHSRTHAHNVCCVCTSPGALGKGRVKMEMNSAMLQVATQICICNYPQKHMRSLLSLSLSLLLSSSSPISCSSVLPPFSSSPLSPISFFFSNLYRFPFSACISNPLFLPRLSHPLCLKGFPSDACWAN